jgi:hypothetical protein
MKPTNSMALSTNTNQSKIGSVKNTQGNEHRETKNRNYHSTR